MNVDNRVIDKLIELVNNENEWEISTDAQAKTKCIISMLEQIRNARAENKRAYENGERRDMIKYDIQRSIEMLNGLIDAW